MHLRAFPQRVRGLKVGNFKEGAEHCGAGIRGARERLPGAADRYPPGQSERRLFFSRMS